METTICVAPKITKRKYTRRNSQRITENPFTTIDELTPVVHKSTLVTEMSQPTLVTEVLQPTSNPVVMASSNEPTLIQSQQLPIEKDTNCVPKKITKRRYTRRKTTENPVTLVNASIPVAIKRELVTEMLQSNGSLVAQNSPSESVSQLPVVNETNCIPMKITKRRYTRRKTVDIPFPKNDESTLTSNLANLMTQPNYPLVAAKSPQPQHKPPVVNDTNCVPKKITKRRYTRRNSFPMIDRPTFTTNSVPVVKQPTFALVRAKSPSENVFPQPKPPVVNDTNCVPKKVTKRRYTRRNSCRNVENHVTVTNVNTAVVATPTSVTGIHQSHCALKGKSSSEPELLQSNSSVVNDTNFIPKKITKRRYTRRNSCKTTENPFTTFDAPISIALTSSPLIVTPQPEPVPPVENNHPPETEKQQAEQENEMWYHKKAYRFLKSLKQDYKRFKYLFNYLLREEQERERRNIQELDELKRIYNRMQVEETETKRKRWCRYCELEASYLTSVGIQFYCSKECERKQNNLLSAVEDSLKRHTE